MKDYEEFTSRGVILQINFLSIIGYYSPQVKKKTESLISADMVKMVGTDCHNLNQAELYKKCQTQKSWHDLVNSNKLLNASL